VSSELRERNYATLREILEQSAASSAEMGTNEQKVGDFWASGMDTQKLEADGATALSSDFDRVDSIESIQELQTLLNELQAEGTAVLFDFGVFQDLTNSEQYIVYAVQGGLGLPDRDYYTREDENSIALRDEYISHVSRMLQLAGDSAQDADEAAAAILGIETRLAEASLTNVELYEILRTCTTSCRWTTPTQQRRITHGLGSLIGSGWDISRPSPTHTPSSSPR
jgi:putative endopeptidase